MAKTPWQWLGLPRPTSDKKAIKRAYAQQLKVYHPEDHPEEFQALQAAYQKALKRASELAAEEGGSRGASGADSGRAPGASKAGPALGPSRESGKTAGHGQTSATGPAAAHTSRWPAPEQASEATPPPVTVSDQTPDAESDRRGLVAWQAPEAKRGKQTGQLKWQADSESTDQTGQLNWQAPGSGSGPERGASDQEPPITRFDLEAEVEATDQEDLDAHVFYGFEDEADGDADSADQDGEAAWADSVFRADGLGDVGPDQAGAEATGATADVHWSGDYQVDIAALLASFRGFLDDSDLRSLVDDPALMTQLRQHQQLDALDEALAQLAITEHKGRRKRLKALAKAHGFHRLVKRIGWRLPEAPHWRLYFVLVLLVVGPLIHRLNQSSEPSRPSTPSSAVDFRNIPSLPLSSFSMPSFSFSLNLGSSGNTQDERLDRLTGPTGNQSLWIGEVERLTDIATVWPLENNSHLLQTREGQFYLHLGPRHRLMALSHYQAAKRVTVTTEDRTDLEAIALQTNGEEPTWYLLELSEGRAVAPITGTVPNGDTGRVQVQTQADPMTAQWLDAN